MNGPLARTGGTSPDSRARNALRICDFLIIAGVVYILVTIVAMFFYPGGNYLDHGSAHYSFTENFFSDLGATRTYGHAANGVSTVLFALSLTLVGVSLVFFGLNYWVVYRRKRRGLLLGRLSLAAAVVSGLSFVGIAATPWNINLAGHLLMVQQAFGFLLVFIFLTLVLQVLNGWPVRWMVPSIVYLVLLAAYLVLLNLGADIETHSGLVLQVLAQKLIVYASIADLGCQAWGMRQVLLAA